MVFRSLERAQPHGVRQRQARADYFKLYRFTVDAIKGVDSAAASVGGPATAGNAWIEDFLAHLQNERACRSDFITHPSLSRPTTFGQARRRHGNAIGGKSTRSVVAGSKRSEVRRPRRATLPVYYTEWCTSSNPRDDALHDEPYAAAFIVKTVMEANGVWCKATATGRSADIFEENYFPSVPFHGGFGLLNLHGVAKPAYRAFQLLHRARRTRIPAEMDGKPPDPRCVVRARKPRRPRSCSPISPLPRHRHLGTEHRGDRPGRSAAPAVTASLGPTHRF